jgi:hypothetical protein
MTSAKIATTTDVATSATSTKIATTAEVATSAGSCNFHGELQHPWTRLIANDNM